MSSTNPIYLRDILEELSLAVLKRIARILGNDSGFTSRARLLQEIPELLERNILITDLPKTSNEVRYGLIVTLALEEATRYFDDNELDEIRKQNTTDIEFSHPLIINAGDKKIRRIPQEFLATAKEQISDSLVLDIVDDTAHRIILPRESAFTDLLTIWTFALKKPIALTRGNFLKKRQLEGLTSLLCIDEDEELITRICNYFNMSRFGLIFDYTCDSKILKNRQRYFDANTDFARGIDLSEKRFPLQIIKQMFGLGLSQYGFVLLSILTHNGGPVKVEGIISLADRICGAGFEQLLSRFLFVLFVLGYVGFFWVDDELVVFLVDSYDKQTDTQPPLLVSANFEVKIPFSTSPELRLRLVAFANLKKADVFLDYEINKESVYAALNDGITSTEIITFLSDNSRYPIPQNVSFAITNWERQFNAITFKRGLFLLADNQETLHELENLPGIQNATDGIVKMYGLEIKEQEYENVKAILKQAGFLPRSLPRKFDSRDYGDVSVLFRNDEKHSDKTKINIEGMDSRQALKRTIEFARQQSRRMRFILRSGEEVIDEIVSVSERRDGLVIKLDNGITLKQSDIVDFILE